MKTKISITLTEPLLSTIDEHAGEFRSRSEFIEAAVTHFLTHLERQETECRDLEIINRRADTLNREAEDTLSYQSTV
ncbi:MAG: ribbon-helix-helix domain-containing protein [bacterium]